MAEKIIADVLDTALARHYEQLGDAEREKQAVVFMDGRWAAIRGDFTPDEIREAVEYIHRYRVSKKLQKSLENISPFVVDNGEIFIKDAFITGGAIQSAAIETPQPVTNIYNISFGVRSDKPEQNKATISVDKFEVKSGIDTNLESLLENMLKNAAECAARDVAKQVAADQKAMDELAKTIRKAIHNECLAGGIIWQRFNR
ncbi:TPA: phage tail tip fiber protein [Citrobacter freundii]